MEGQLTAFISETILVIVDETTRMRLTIEMRRITLRPMKIRPAGRLGAEEGRRELMSEELEEDGEVEVGGRASAEVTDDELRKGEE